MTGRKLLFSLILLLISPWLMRFSGWFGIGLFVGLILTILYSFDYTAEIHRREQQHHRRDDGKRHDGEPYIAHAGRKADGHREEQRSNLLRCARRGAEAHEPERARHRDEQVSFQEAISPSA